MELGGGVALVTGGAHRVGGAISLALAAAGMHVAVAYRSSAAAAEEMVEAVRREGSRGLAVETDVADPARVARAVAAVTDELGPVDVLVNSASAFATDTFPADDLTVWRQTMDVVLDGTLHCANAVAPSMLERASGVIVNIVDLSAWQPWPGRTAHSVAKAAVLALTRQLAVELAPSVRCNAVALGPTIPPLRFSEDQVERLRARTLLGRWAGGEEAGRAVRYLAEADAVTGECLTVDSGEQYGHVRNRFTDP